MSVKNTPIVRTTLHHSPRRSGSSARSSVASKGAHRRTLLWIDDYEPGLAVYKALFERYGFRVLTSSRGRSGLALAVSNALDAVIVDYEMPDMAGDAVAAALRATQPGLPIILFSAHADLPDRTKRLFDACCEKTMSRDAILATIEDVLARRSAAPLRSRLPMPLGHGYHT